MRNSDLSQEELRQLFLMDPEVIDIEDKNGQVCPVVRTYDDEEHSLLYWCIHCRTWHVHGRGGKGRPYEEGRGGMADDRGGQCFAANSPFNQTGVILHVIGKFDASIRKLHKEGRDLFCPVCRDRYSAAFNACNCGRRFVNKTRKSNYPEMSEKYQGLCKPPSANRR
jgi:hypothetical protein